MIRKMDNRLEKRGTWGSWFEFVFAFLGNMVGYGNIWRFPFVCYMNGGGAFLLPFLVSIFVLGLPLTFLQLTFSQYSNYGPGRVWEVCPLFKGIGFGSLIKTFIVNIYYTMIMAWTVFYMVNSFKNPIPWSSCDNEWNTENCTLSFNETLRAILNDNSSESQTLSLADDKTTRVSPAEEFWFNKALDETSGISDLGIIKWELVLCLLASWIVAFLCLIKGIHSLGKVVYVSATLPYIALTCLLIRGCMLPGSGNGLYYLLVPRWELLVSFTVWRDAATQLFYSTGLGSASTATLASYNKFHNNCYKDALIMPLLDSITSLFAGLVVFSYLGYTSHVTGKEMDDVVAKGPGLVFMVYPSALATLPLPQFWSVLFFFMLFTMGLDSQFAQLETVITGIVDIFPAILPRKALLTGMLCIMNFCLGLPLTTQGGNYILNLIDWHLASVSLMLIAFLEVAVLAWIYGTDRLYSDIEHMIGYRPNGIFKYAWRFSCPAIVFFLWIAGFVFFRPISVILHGFNVASDIGGIIIALIPVVAIPITAVWQLYKRDGSFITRLKDSLRPSPLWLPAISYADNEHEMEEEEFMNVMV